MTVPNLLAGMAESRGSVSSAGQFHTWGMKLETWNTKHHT